MLYMHSSLLLWVCCSLQSNLSSKLSALFRTRLATNEGGITVKVLRDFFQGCVAGLNVEEIYDDKLKSKPSAVEDVILPANMIECDRIDILIEEH